MQPRRMIQSFLLVAVLALAAACGGDTSREDYERRVDEVDRRLEREFAKFRDGRPTEAQMRAGAKLIDAAADDLDDIEPPSDVADTHERLVETVRRLGASLRTMAPALGAGGDDDLSDADERALVQAQEDSQDAIEGLQRAQQEFEDAGYDIELGAGASADTDDDESGAAT